MVFWSAYSSWSHPCGATNAYTDQSKEHLPFAITVQRYCFIPTYASILENIKKL